MSQRTSGSSNRDLSDAFTDFLGSASRLLVFLGLVGTVVSVAFLVYYLYAFGSAGATLNASQAMTMVDIFRNVLIACALAVGVGCTYLFWGEQTLGVLMIVAGCILYFSPYYVPSVLGNNGSSAVYNAALGAIVMGGGALGLLGILVTVIDVGIRIKDRSDQGSRADQLKFGKGIKEEVDRHNVFMGKCWQLPFCRKFVRERCPIYHSRRTCWKELVGCMCEEQVIRDAMGGKVIPKDAVSAASYIPHNNKLTFNQKRERCKVCVIYNEHQKHKYKATLWPTVLGVIGIYALAHGPLVDATSGIVDRVTKVFNAATLQSNAASQVAYFPEILLACIVLLLLTYVIKLLEYLFFTAKV